MAQPSAHCVGRRPGRRTGIPGLPAALVLSVSMAVTEPVSSQTPPPALPWAPVMRDSTVPLFASPDVLPLTLVANFRQIKRDRDDDSPERPAWIHFAGAGGTTDSLEVQLRTRGNFRLQRRNCNFPPLRVNLQRGDTRGTVFEGQDKVKLVTHCQDGRDRYEQYVLQEYLAYRVYDMLTPVSHRVRLARIRYVDTDGDSDPLVKYAFFIEHEDDLASRFGAAILDSGEIHQENLDYDYTTLLAVFQYYIANVDWSVSARHNVLILDVDNRQPIGVPFDFDWAGVINTSYAGPPPNVPIRDVTERLFVSPCRSQYDLDPVFALLRSNREAIYALYANQVGLEERQVRRIHDYFDEFYETIDDPRRLRRTFIRGCFGRG